MTQIEKDLELLRCAQANFENLERLMPLVKEHYMYIISKCQLNEVVGEGETLEQAAVKSGISVFEIEINKPELQIAVKALVHIHGQPFKGSWDAQAVFVQNELFKIKSFWEHRHGH